PGHGLAPAEAFGRPLANDPHRASHLAALRVVAHYVGDSSARVHRYLRGRASPAEAAEVNNSASNLPGSTRAAAKPNAFRRPRKFFALRDEFRVQEAFFELSRGRKNSHRGNAGFRKVLSSPRRFFPPSERSSRVHGGFSDLPRARAGPRRLFRPSASSCGPMAACSPFRELVEALGGFFDLPKSSGRSPRNGRPDVRSGLVGQAGQKRE